MLDVAGRIWDKLREFMGRIDTLEKESGKTRTAVEHVGNRLDLVEKGMRQQDKIIDHQGKMIDHQGRGLADAQQEIKKLKSEKHGKAVSAGIAKKQLEKLKELNGPKDPKRRH